MSDSLNTDIRAVLRDHARLPVDIDSLADDADLFQRLLDAAAGRSVDFVYQRYQLGSYAGLELARRLDVPLVLEFNGSEIWVERHWGSGRLRLGGSLERLDLR